MSNFPIRLYLVLTLTSAIPVTKKSIHWQFAGRTNKTLCEEVFLRNYYTLKLLHFQNVIPLLVTTHTICIFLTGIILL